MTTLNAAHNIFATRAAAEAFVAKLGGADEGERFEIEACGARFVVVLYDEDGRLGVI